MTDTTYDGHSIRSERSLAPAAVVLIGEIARSLGFAPGVAYFADVVKRDDLFPGDSYDMARRQKLNRALATPVQVDDMLLVVVSGERRMYQKTKTIELRHGTLGATAAPAPAPAAASRAYLPPPPPNPGLPVAPHSAPAPAAPYSAPPVDAEALRARISEVVANHWVLEAAPPTEVQLQLDAIRERLNAVGELVDTKMQKRLVAVEINVDRMHKYREGIGDPNAMRKFYPDDDKRNFR